jgi:hypothetical protein
MNTECLVTVINVTRNVAEGTDFLIVWSFLQYTRHIYMRKITNIIITAAVLIWWLMRLQLIIHKWSPYLVFCRVLSCLHSVNITLLLMHFCSQNLHTLTVKKDIGMAHLWNMYIVMCFNQTCATLHMESDVWLKSILKTHTRILMFFSMKMEAIHSFTMLITTYKITQ